MSVDRWEGGELSPEEAERLSSRFKPSWELEAETVAASPPRTEGEGSPATESVTAAAPASAEDESVARKQTLLGMANPTVIVAEMAPAPPVTVQEASQSAPPSQAAMAPSPLPASAPPRATAVEAAPLPSIVIDGMAGTAPAPKRPTPPISIEEAPTLTKPGAGFGKGLYVGLGVGAAAVIAAVLLSSAGSKEEASQAPSVVATTEAPRPQATAPVDPPKDDEPSPAPQATTAEQAEPAPSVVPAAAPPKEPPVAEPVTKPAALPVRAEAKAPPAPAPKPTPAPAPKPAAKAAPTPAAKPHNPSNGSAIVRDTPF